MLRLPLICLLMSLLASTTASAGDWRQGWGLVSPAPPTPHAGSAEGAAPMARLRLQPVGTQWQARIDNGLAGPLQIELRAAPGRPVEGLPLQSLIQGDSSLVVGHLPAPLDGRTLDLRLQSVPGNPAAQAEDVAYRLPFDAARPRVDQAPQGRFSHDDEENRDAVDFALPEGTLVLAAREGTVMQIQDGFRGNGQDRERDGARANFIRVLHSDGSMALYGHLQAGGMRVRRGQAVGTGQPLGLSGNSGFSSAPHLHFVVQVNRGMGLRSVPARIFAEQGQLQFARQGEVEGGIGR
ncbi:MULTISPECIES: M23 family metallopeptidase [Stenotrophomonas]|jgi:murein DD-endopeptidase MepM/ murein hydrolase activator NlpD|uniref:M23 family metallopeptidase n=1 Tax=Stenotrophomonas TaxID=40323 RepID=UPI00066CF6D8|nr:MULTISPECIES: M23 family metallopeptidase [Stenotrophomonas]MBH1696837.1 M23 family metallopeptidase [Stenotrophomonas maltophilia]MDH0553162.1 M23 family metallopeptidase [Stenotrophomonas sp. GD04006]PJL47788.1 peptidase [Stenotrophomonas maltophilia]